MSNLRLISLAVVFVLGLLCTGCAGGGVPAVLTETPPPPVATSTAAGSTPTSMPSLSATGTPTLAPPAASPTLTPLSPSELKYRILAQFSPIFFCDPDLYPVAHEVGDQEISQRVATLLKNAEESGTILRHLGLAGATTLTPQQKNLIYAESKKLNAINLQPAGDKYTFSLRTGEGKGQGLAISGVIDRAGNVTVTQRQSTILTCPICLAADTSIETPQGPVHVQDLKSGMPVWTIDRRGARRSAVILETIHRAVPSDFRIIHLTLDDGRALFVSPNHPTVDGRTIGELSIGDMLDGVLVASIVRTPYAGATYDILPSGETGAYWANGILLKSSLAR